MRPTPHHSTKADAAGQREPTNDRHEVALEPSQAWCLKGMLGDPDEVVIPGLLLDDLGGCASVEAMLDLATFYQMLAMASVQETRMLTARNAAAPGRTRPEANVWAVTGTLVKAKLAIRSVRALDRVVVDGYGTRRIETMPASQLLPGPRAWR